MDALTTSVLLGAALLHASWNALLKGGRDGLVQLFWIQVASAALGGVLLGLAGLPERASWPWLAGSIAWQQVYLVCLVNGYARADLSIVYPIARGSAPLLVALGAALVAGEVPGPRAAVGLVLISGAVLGLTRPGRPGRPGRAGSPEPGARSPHGVAFALATGLAIAGYTLCDARGVRLAGGCDARGVRLAGGLAAYAGLQFFVTALPLTLWMLARRGARLRVEWTRRAPQGLLAGTLALSSYGLALWALRRAPAGPVSALRETSVLFAAWIGPWWLGERREPKRWLAAAAIALGVLFLRAG